MQQRILLLTLLLLSLISNVSLNAQTITGTLTDQDASSPLEFATVTLLSPQDSGLLKGVVTDLDGRFSIDTKVGTYLVKAEFVGYQAQYFNNLTLTEGQTLELGKIALAAEAQVMEAIEIRAEKSTMQMALDKKIFNVGKDLASTSGSAAEVLDNIPSVQVGVEGEVSLRGSSGVRILIDGKPSSLLGVGGTDGLRSLPANLIDRIEVITNPSSRYEAEGMSGIINIILKKDRRQGFNGSFDLTGGLPESAGVSFNLNYRKDKLNFFTNYGYNHRQRPTIRNLYQEFYREDGTTSFVDQTGDRVRGGQSHNFRFGADYFANEKNTITTSFALRRSNNNNTSDFIYRNYENDFPGNLTGISTCSEDSQEIEPNLEFSINHKKTYERDGHEWSNSIQYRSSVEDQFSQFEELFFDGDLNQVDRDNLLQRAANKEGEGSLLFRSDYTYPFADDGKFEMGYFGSLRRIDNDYLVEQFADDTWNVLTNLSNDFNYDENIQALYANVGNKKGRVSYQIELRAEYSSVLTELLQTSEVNDRNYINLFPSAFFTYDLSASNSIQLSYSRRLRRPRFRDLNPFFTFSDSRNIFRGNPNLDPEFTHSFEASHIKYWDKASISSSVYYRRSTGVIERIQSLFQENGELITVRQPENLATSDAYGFEFIYTVDPTEWWRINGSANFYREIVDGTNFREDLYQDAVTWFTRINSRFTIKKALDLQLRANYRAPRNTTQGRSLSLTTIDFALSKDVFKGKGTFTVGVRDIFNAAFTEVLPKENFSSQSLNIKEDLDKQP